MSTDNDRDHQQPTTGEPVSCSTPPTTKPPLVATPALPPDEVPPPERVSFGFLARHLLELFNFERGLGYTCWRWLREPGQAAEDFLFRDRKRFVKPLTLLTLIVAIVTYVSFQLVGLREQLTLDNPIFQEIPERARDAVQRSLQGVQSFLNVFLVIALPFQAGVLAMMFRQQRWHYPEHFVVVVYIYSMQSLLSLVQTPLIFVWPSLFGGLTAVITLLYVWWALGQVYPAPWYRVFMAFLMYLIIGSLVPGLAAGILFVWFMLVGI